MKKTMRKSALLSSVAMLIVSAIVLTSATYAWFSSSKQVYVNELDASVKVTTGLLISVDKGGKWGTSFEFSQAVAANTGWKSFNEFKTAGGIFNPVSTADGNDWFAATYEDADTGLVEQPVNLGGDFVAVPIWVTGPVGEEVQIIADFTDTDETAAKNAKFTLLRVDDEGKVIETYNKAIAADGSTGTFNGVSAAGTTDTTENSAYVTSGGATITEVAADGSGMTFTIDENTTTTAPMKFVAYIWLEGNDPDCKMLDFDVAGEDIKFDLSLKLAD